MEQAWTCPWPDADAFRTLDYKLRNTAKALQSWSAKHVGSDRLQLAIAKELVLRLDCAQDIRQLAPHELRLRRKAKLNCLGLASLLRTITRQRSRLTYLAEGDANTRFFHLQACHRNRKSAVGNILMDDMVLINNEEKANAFFEHFDQLLGTSCRTSLKLDLDQLALPRKDLSGIDICFTEDEIWQAIKEIPLDKAPGPDGFTGLFYRTAWSIIKIDIIRAFHALWSLDGRSLYLVNQAYMILLKKKTDASTVHDFRPISLIHSFAKLFAKVLARRLSPHMNDLVRFNQSAFISGRIIHENFQAVQLTASLLHRKHIPSTLFKVDIAKAFDSVHWSFLLEILRHLGFSRRWTNWISMLLSTASTKIILNGQPGRRICHARGLRQGDPLSPLLFVLVMEPLNALFRLAVNKQVLGPLGNSNIPERIFLYADDVILFSSIAEQDLVAVGTILSMFAAASGLHTNPDKCAITPIRCNLNETATLMRFLPGALKPFPIQYLGIPLSIHKPKKSDLQHLVDKVVVGLPTWKAGLLTKAGRTVLVKSKMSAVPVYTAIAISISPWVLKCVDKRRRAFLWKGTESVSGGHCALAWPKVCRPLDLGGLGIPDLRLQGHALCMRWLWAKSTDPNRPWATLPDHTENLVLDMFCASISVEIGNGQRSYFWTDRWIQGKGIRELAPALLAAVRPRVQQHRTVAQGLLNRAWVRDITGALTVQVIVEYLQIWNLVENQVVVEQAEDRFIWKWTADHCFTTASAYRAFFVGQHPIPGAKMLRKTRAPGRCKFFVWLALHDRCWTAARRKRHNLQDNDTCGACLQLPETISHILIGCIYAREVWSTLFRRWHWLGLSAGLSDDREFYDWWNWSRKQVPGLNRKAFDTLVVLTFWMLWKERNNRIFQNSNLQASDLVLRIFDEAKSWAYAGFNQLQKLFPDVLFLRSQNPALVIV